MLLGQIRRKALKKSATILRAKLIILLNGHNSLANFPIGFGEYFIKLAAGLKFGIGIDAAYFGEKVLIIRTYQSFRQVETP